MFSSVSRSNATSTSCRGSLQGLCSVSRRCTAVRVAARDGTGVVQTSSSVADDRWQSLTLMRMQLRLAVRDEDYATASRLKQQIATVTESLPWRFQVLFGAVEKLQSDSLSDKLEAIQTLSITGDACVIPELTAQLQDPRARHAAEAALRAIHHRHADPECQEFMSQGLALLEANKLDMAQLKFERLVQLDPNWAEAWNKLATVRYLSRQYSESIADCHRALEIEGYHFGALSGMGLNYLSLRDPREAIKWFKRALEVNPGLENLRKYIQALSQAIQEPDNDPKI